MNWFQEQEEVLTEDITGTGNPVEIVVYNDDVNTFDWVIQCFMEVLQHSQDRPNSCRCWSTSRERPSSRPARGRNCSPKRMPWSSAASAP
jgi:ATP-dependent Clp protease adaptor protein ClpS